MIGRPLPGSAELVELKARAGVAAMHYLASPLAGPLADPSVPTESGGERIALYSMIGVLGSALIGAIGLAVNTWLGRRPVTLSDDAARIAVLEFWVAYVLGVNPDLIRTGHESWDEVHGGATRPTPGPRP